MGQSSTGILNNEMYIGRLVWNRLAYIKNPETGKRVSRLNPVSGWIVKEVPLLRLVDQELWDRVKERQLSLRKVQTLQERRRPRMLLSYLLKCGVCGGGFSKVSQEHYGCSMARNKGVCDNRRTIRRDKLEGMVLSALQSQLMDPGLLAEFCEEYRRYLNTLRMEKNAAREAAKKELEKIARERANLVQAVKDGMPGHLLKDDIEELDNRSGDLRHLLAEVKEEPVLLHPGLSSHYRAQVANLIEVLSSDENRAEAAGILRSLVDRIVLTPNERGELDVDLHGDLAGILTLATKSEGRPKDRTAKLIQQVTVVAGVGFEPTTFRL